jgi:hypothetical protein
MALSLFTIAFATSEFQAVQFMPAVVVMPQVLLGGLFVPREDMTGWLQTISDVLPLTSSIRTSRTGEGHRFVRVTAHAGLVVRNGRRSRTQISCATSRAVRTPAGRPPPGETQWPT